MGSYAMITAIGRTEATIGESDQNNKPQISGSIHARKAFDARDDQGVNESDDHALILLRTGGVFHQLALRLHVLGLAVAVLGGAQRDVLNRVMVVVHLPDVANAQRRLRSMYHNKRTHAHTYAGMSEHKQKKCIEREMCI